MTSHGTTSSSLLRLALLVVASFAHDAACTAPPAAKDIASTVLREKAKNVQGSTGNLIGGDMSHDRAGVWVVQLFLGLLKASKYLMWAITTVEGVSRILSIFPASRLSAILLPTLLPSLDNPSYPNIHTSHLSSPPSTSFVVSAISIVVGWRIRKACFDALGRQFTFTHTTLNKHALVTDGPYAVVRHPGYVGMFFLRVGGIGLFLSSGGWARTTGAVSWSIVEALVALNIDSTRSDSIGVSCGRIFISIYSIHAVLELVALFVRAPQEDTTLREKFGLEWSTYKKKVPWMLIPYVV